MLRKRWVSFGITELNNNSTKVKLCTIRPSVTKTIQVSIIVLMMQWKLSSKNISNNIRFKYTWEDISLILEIKDEYFDLCCQSPDDSICEFPIEINEEELRQFIMLHTAQNDIQIPESDLIEILDAELVYFEQNGALRDAGEYLN
jgi:hypothetical protein